MNGAGKVILIIFLVLFLMFLLALNVKEKPRARRLVTNMNLGLCTLILIATIASVGMMIWKNNMGLAIFLIAPCGFSLGLLVHAYKTM